MTGFDCLGADEIGFDYTSLLKGAGGLLSGVAEGFGSGDKGGGDKSTAAMMEKMRQEEARRKAEQSASTMKMVLIGLAALLGVGGVAFLIARK